jgi:hypothetical protein
MCGLMAVVLSLVACDKVSIDEDDESPPTVEINIRAEGEEYSTPDSIDIGAGDRITVFAVVKDPQGIRGLNVSFLGSTASDCNVDGKALSGSFLVELPDPLEQFLDASGQVVTSLPILTDIEFPQCRVPTSEGVETGQPYGHTITVKATGYNWSSDAQNSVATDEVDITLTS